MAWKKRGENSEGGKFRGGTWHIFPHSIEKNYVDGEVQDRILWRGVISMKSGKMYWKGSQDKDVVEKWVQDKIFELREIAPPKGRDDTPKKNKKTVKRNHKRAIEYLQNIHKKKNNE